MVRGDPALSAMVAFGRGNGRDNAQMAAIAAKNHCPSLAQRTASEGDQAIHCAVKKTMSLQKNRQPLAVFGLVFLLSCCFIYTEYFSKPLTLAVLLFSRYREIDFLQGFIIKFDSRICPVFGLKHLSVPCFQPFLFNLNVNCFVTVFSPAFQIGGFSCCCCVV